MGTANSLCCHKELTPQASPIDQTDILFEISYKSDPHIKNSMHKISKLMAANHFNTELTHIKQQNQLPERISRVNAYLHSQTAINDLGYVIGNNLSLRRYYDPINNTLSGYQHYITLYQFNPKDSDAEIQKNVTIKSIIENLQIQQPFKQYPQAQYTKKMIEDLNCLKGFPGWRVKAKLTFQQMESHLLYNYHRFMPILNSSISLSDSYSLSKVASLHNFIANHLCKNQNEKSMINQQYGNTYQMEMGVENVEEMLYSTKSFVFFTGFIKMKPMDVLPIIEGDLESKIHVQGKGKSYESKVKFIVKNTLQNAFKYIIQEHLCYLPLALFIIKSINNDQNRKIIELEEYDKQFLIEKTLIPHPSKSWADSNMAKEDLNLQNYSNSLQKQIQSMFSASAKSQSKSSEQQINNKDNTNDSQVSFNLTKQYYQAYKKRLNAQKQMKETKQQSKCMKQPQIDSEINELQLQKQREQRKIKRLKEQAQLQLQEESQAPQIVALDPKTQKKYSQTLLDYIDDKQLYKFQQQILNVDRFWLLTTINLNNCHLTKIQHMKCFPNLQNVYLYSNYIQILEGFDTNQQIRILSLARNNIRQINNIHHLQHLRGLYIGCNPLNKSSALYLESNVWKAMRNLSISFQCEQIQQCYTILMNSQRLPKLKNLHINNASLIPTQIKQKLKNFTKTQFTT